MSSRVVTRGLAIFDVDGTLVESVAIDAHCFVRALADAAGITGVDESWVASARLSDTGITHHLFRRRFHRAPRQDESDRLRRGFVQLLAEATYKEVPGALKAVRALSKLGWTIGIATGGWRDCALVKLSGAGIDIAGMPAAFAEDGHRKLSILEAARHRAGDRFDATVYFGDSPEDFESAKKLRMGFVGVGGRSGASNMMRDLSDEARLFKALFESARSRIWMPVS